MTVINLKESILEKVENPSRRKFLETAGKVGAVVVTIGVTSLVIDVAKAFAQSQFQDSTDELRGNNNPSYPVSGPTPPNPSNYIGMSWEQIREQLDTPEKVLDYMVTIRYQMEPPGSDHAQTPEETVRLGTGDCEDTGFLGKDALEYHGYKAKILGVEARLPNGNYMGHAALVYKDKETKKWHYITGNGFLSYKPEISGPHNSIDSIAREFAGKMGGTVSWKDTFDSVSAYNRLLDK